MSYSKPLPPFVCDSLYYFNRDKLERISIVCRPFKNFIDRYLHTKPYRVFDELWIRRGWLDIRGGSYALFHNNVRWHPNRDDYSAQQFLAGKAMDKAPDSNDGLYYSFAKMHAYLGQTVRINVTWIDVSGDTTYGPKYTDQIESIAHVWCDRKIIVWKAGRDIVADDMQLILDSPTILQCRFLSMRRAHFSFKDYKILYNPKIIENHCREDKTDPDYWLEFIEQPQAKPLVVFRYLHRESINNLLDHLSKAFSSAVSPNAFKIVFFESCKPLTEFQKTNETSGEKLELKRGLPTEYQKKNLDRYFNYTLERSSI